MLKIGQYEIDKTALISRNSESDIMQAQSKQNKYAAKVVLKGLGPQAVQKFRYESKMLKAINSSYAARYINYLETEKYAVLLMELTGKSLKSIQVRSDSEVDEVRTIFREVLLGLHQLHNLQIAHRNIEPGNIMISENRRVKIIDFQNAVYFQNVIHNNHLSLKETSGYESPQILAKQPHDEKVDIWSAGVLFHWMLFGQLPFDNVENGTRRELLKSIQSVCSGGYKLNERLFGRHYKNISRTIESFLKQMLEIDSSKRASTEQLLCHPIFQQKFKMKLFIYDRGKGRKLDSKLSTIPSFFANQTQLSTKLQSLLNNGDYNFDYQKYIMYKFPLDCLQSLEYYDNDIYRKQMKLFRCYVLCISKIYSLSLLTHIRKQNKQQSDFYYRTIQSDYFSIKSSFEMELFQFQELYPYEPDTDLENCNTFESIKYKYRSLCQQLTKSCLETYNQSVRSFDQRSMHLRLGLRLTLLSIINRLFTHEKCKKLNMIKEYWEAQKQEITKIETFNAFIDGVGYEKSNQYIKEIMKMFD